MIPGLFSINELDFALDRDCTICGFSDWSRERERESKGKAAGIGTHCFVIGGSMIVKYISALVDPNFTSRFAAQIVTGIGFLGAGIILKDELFDNKGSDNLLNRKVVNLTTAASIWFSGAIGMAIEF